MKRKLSDKQNRVLWLVGSGIWLANAGLNGWLLITRWERLVDTGQATKIIIPSELQAMAGLATGITEVMKGEK